ncbi:HD-GYP domain-containing protein [Neorhizobium galegae]|uniref:HD-GYP domain-containing protein n=1 Tax=Neorhizobium galegae TaxID=399 RepID=UPI0006220A56|nr:HD-GYP domain-containing protein [Neorhizobium galegae]CDZ55622.1 Putative metal-dependent phosphohydrolase (HD region) [Neorhizobium galegae bv. orientalis]
MRKRIRLHEVRVGMFIDEVESGSQAQPQRFSPFLVSSVSEIQRIMNSNVMTVVIDIRKGRDVEPGNARPQTLDRAQFEATLLGSFSAKEVDQARQAIEETKPHIRNVLAEARLNGGFASDAADFAVERIMSAASSNAGALIGVAKLKQKDEITFLHSLAVSALMISFGRSLGLREEDIRLLGVGGLVHDLGKMTLPDAILKNTGKLTAEEMELVRMHPQRGYEIVSRIANTPRQILDICRYHHEKLDGSGYPSGLSGPKIPYVARLAAICDVYDALTTVRPYKRAWSQAEAVNVMMTSQGHFDDELLAAFVSKMVISGTLH